MENRKELKLKKDDKIEFTEDGWNTSYKGKIISVHPYLGYYKVYGFKYGYASCSESQVKLIEK